MPSSTVAIFIRRAPSAAAPNVRESGIRFVDCGTSGGGEAARSGAYFVVGGDGGVFELERISEAPVRKLTVV